MKYKDLREEVCTINRGIVAAGLVTLTWGNASAIDRKEGVFAIKPSGIPYESLKPEDIVVLDLESGDVVEGSLKPSSDTPTHLELFRAFDGIGGIVHTHSTHATIWAQAGREIPCLGTTHADHFNGKVPVARALTQKEVQTEYEVASGRAIVETFRAMGLNPDHVPAVLLPGHAPFVWGATLRKALENAIALEAVAEMALHTLSLNTNAALPDHVLEKHFTRKHGPKAYYGQK
ncbi:MAG: L-ribulose-5-phosphate 4-epimerase AraD [Candidatus Sumerlaeia bacterium]|nr:L-ribulose-5-phosphate 4-epimerase AraD [Candidatus Sumerlaeia bacterium]